MSEVFFFFAAIGAVAGAAGTVLLRDAFYSVLALVSHLIFLAMLFLLLRAEFVAAAQVIVYTGVGGVLTRRNPLVVLLSLELMLNAANLALVAFARAHGDMGGQIFALIVMVVAACEVAVGLGLVVALFRRRLPIDVDELRELQG